MSGRTVAAVVLLLALSVALPSACCASPAQRALGDDGHHHSDGAAGVEPTASSTDAHCAAPADCCERVAGAASSPCCQAAPALALSGQAERAAAPPSLPIAVDEPTLLARPAPMLVPAAAVARGGPLYTLHSSLLI